MASALATHAENWPQFRGSKGGVASDDPALPDAWSTTQNVAWKIDIPGRSWSSPVVWGDHVFVTTAIDTAGDKALRPTSEYIGRSGGGTMTFQDLENQKTPIKWVVYDIDFKTGKIRWQQDAATAVPAQTRHQKNSYASETPVTDGERVYAYFGNVGLFAYDMNGKLVWSQKATPVKTRTGFGAAASPILHNDRLILVNDNDEQSYIAAYDKRTGKELWRTNRDEHSNWSTPFIWQNDRRTEIVTAGTDKIRSYDLDGKLLWELKGMSIYAIPTPLAADGLLYITSGYPADKVRPVYAIRPGAVGDITLKADQTSNDFIAWSNPTIGPYNPSALVYQGCYYTLIDRGFLTCHDPKTGKELYGRQRITMDATSFTASLWAYNGHVFGLSEEGDTFVVDTTDEFKLVRTNSLDDFSMASPAIVGDRLLIRTQHKLWSIRNKK